MKPYSDISLPTLTDLLDNAKWVVKSDTTTSDIDWVLLMYSPKNALAGLMDYRDHNKLGHSLNHYRELVYTEVKHRLMQIGNYYDINEKPFDTVVITLERSGWSADAKCSNGNACYFTHVYTESAKRAAEKRAAEKAAKKLQKKRK